MLAGVCSRRPEHLTPKQEIKLAEVLSFSLKVVRCYLLKEAFQIFWDYHSADSRRRVSR